MGGRCGSYELCKEVRWSSADKGRGSYSSFRLIKWRSNEVRRAEGGSGRTPEYVVKEGFADPLLTVPALLPFKLFTDLPCSLVPQSQSVQASADGRAHRSRHDQWLSVGGTKVPCGRG